MAKEKGMENGAGRSKALHNFTMPCDLRWGNQRYLRCMRVNSDGEILPLNRFIGMNQGSCYNDRPIQQRRTVRDKDLDAEFSGEFVHGSPSVGPTPRLRYGGDGGRDEDEIAMMREKVMFDLQTAAEKMKDAILKEGREFSVSPSVLPSPPPAPSTDRPWNLRTRRAACKMPIVAGNSAVGSSIDGKDAKVLRFDSARPNLGFYETRSSATAAVLTTQKSPINRIDGEYTTEKNERPKFSVTLLKREIEEDFWSIVGHRPPRRPKKRAKIVQKDLDTLFPGLWLSEITADLYRVAEPSPET